MKTRARAKAETLFASILAPSASRITDSELPKKKAISRTQGPKTLHLPGLSPSSDDMQTTPAATPVRAPRTGHRAWGTAL